ncbi:MAG: preprotein translocase subunit YajC [Clostridia bacterium]|nr:preprotein translocase subunit YajC [Clostridia bacterium]
MLGFSTVAHAAAATTAPEGANMAAMISSFLPLVLIFVFMYVIMIRPQKKKEKALREKISNMKVGDKVVTIGGIVGKVSKIKDDFVIIESGNIGTQDEKSFIKFEKTAIKDVQTKISN